MQSSTSAAAETHIRGGLSLRLGSLAVAVAALLLAARSAHAQSYGGGIRFHPNVMQQGGRSPRPAPPVSAAHAPGGNSLLPATPTTPGAMRNHLQAGPSGRWWDDKRTAQSIGLRVDQKARMDAIFNANRPAIVSAYQTFLKEKERFATLTRQAQPDKAQLFASIDAVNEARTALEKATDKMLLEIRAELDSSQLARLESMQ